MIFDTITDVVLKISDSCPLHCSYCYERDHLSKGYLKEENINDIINWLKTINLGSELRIKFTGGEPTVNIDGIKYAAKTIKRKIERDIDTKVRFGMTTNGYNIKGLNYLISKQLIDPSLLKISFDGIYTERYGLEPNKIESQLKSLYDKQATVRVALTEENIDHIYETFKRLISYGFKYLEYYYLFDYKKYRETLFRQSAYKQFLLLADLYNDNPNIHILNIDNINENNKSSLCSHLGYLIYIDSHGDLYPCQFFSPDSAFQNKPFKLGNIKSGFNKELVKEFETCINSINLTKDCIECKNNHCFECPAVAIYNNKPRLKYECILKDYERKIYGSLAKHTYNGIHLLNSKGQIFNSLHQYKNTLKEV